MERDFLRHACGIRRSGRVKNIMPQNLCGVTKSLNERMEESVLRWLINIDLVAKMN